MVWGVWGPVRDWGPVRSICILTAYKKCVWFLIKLHLPSEDLGVCVVSFSHPQYNSDKRKFQVWSEVKRSCKHHVLWEEEHHSCCSCPQRWGSDTELMPCSRNGCRAARAAASLMLWARSAFSWGSRALVPIKVIGKHIVQILAVAAELLSGTRQGKQCLHSQHSELGTAARPVRCWMWSRNAVQLRGCLSCSNLSHY